MRRLPSLLLIALGVMLAACHGNVRLAKPQVIEVPGPTRYVPIDPRFTTHPALPPMTLPDSNPLQCPAVANARWWLLRDAYRNLDAIKAVQGTPTEKQP